MEHLTLYLPGILLAYSAFFLASTSPGPSVLAIIGTSMSVDRPSGVAFAIGVAFGSLTWACLTVFGLSSLLAAYAEALIAIKIGGGVYLLWLAFKAFKSAASTANFQASELAEGRRTRAGYLLRGYTVQMSNPKAAFAWIAIVSLGLKHDAPYWVGLAIILGTFVLSMTINCLYALAFSTPIMVKIYSKARRSIESVLGVFFAFAGIRLLTSRV